MNIVIVLLLRSLTQKTHWIINCLQRWLLTWSWGTTTCSAPTLRCFISCSSKTAHRMSMCQVIKVLITSALLTLCFHSHKLLFDFVRFMYFGNTDLFHSTSIILHVQTLKIVVRSYLWFRRNDSAFLFEFIPSWLPSTHFGQNTILFFEYAVMFLNVLGSTFIIFHKDLPQIFDKLYFSLLWVSSLAEFCF